MKSAPNLGMVPVPKPIMRPQSWKRAAATRPESCGDSVWAWWAQAKACSFMVISSPGYFSFPLVPYNSYNVNCPFKALAGMLFFGGKRGVPATPTYLIAM